MNTNPHTVLFVDDEKNILNALRRLMRHESYTVMTASSGPEGLRFLEETRAQVIVSDQRMPEMSGVEFLSQVREKHPDAIRILLSGYTDVGSITEAINKGHIYKFLLKPWDDHALCIEIRQALQNYDLVEDNRRLHGQVLKQNEQLKRMNDDLEQIIAERTRELSLQNQALELSHAILEDIAIPIIGLSSEGTVAFINRSTREQPGVGRIEIGLNASSIFYPLTLRRIRGALKEGIPSRIQNPGPHLTGYFADINPLSGRFRQNGVIITLTQIHEVNERP